MYLPFVLLVFTSLTTFTDRGCILVVQSAYCTFPAFLWQETHESTLERDGNNIHTLTLGPSKSPGKLWHSHMTLKPTRNSDVHPGENKDLESDYGFNDQTPPNQYYYKNLPYLNDAMDNRDMDKQWSKGNDIKNDDDGDVVDEADDGDFKIAPKKPNFDLRPNPPMFYYKNYSNSDNYSEKFDKSNPQSIKFKRTRSLHMNRVDPKPRQNYQDNQDDGTPYLDLPDTQSVTSSTSRFPIVPSSYREIFVEPSQIGVKLLNVVTCHDKPANRSVCYSKREIQEISCLSEEVNEKYRVRIKNDGESKFGCMRFIRSWPNVVQVFSAQPKKINDARLCLDPFIKRSVHPWISGNKDAWSFCPFSGGFDFRIYVTGRRKPLCGRSRSHWRPSRLESECIIGEGINFFFQDSKCNFLPLELNGSRLTCWGSFIEGASTYVFFGGINQPRPLYTLRLPSNPPKSKEMWATLYFSIYAPEPDIFSNWNLDEALVESNREELSFPMDEGDLKQVDLYLIKSDGGVCYDESDFCSEFAREGRCVNSALHKFANFCKKSCGLCGHKADLVPSTNSECHFPVEYRGRWLLTETDHMEEVLVEEGQVVFSRLGTFICKSKHWKKEQYKVFSVYQNGCRPRYSCIHFRQEGRILYFQISKSSLFDNSFDLCIFKDDEETLKDAVRSKKLKMLIAHNDLKYDDCNLHGTLRVSITFQQQQQRTDLGAKSGKVTRQTCNGSMTDVDLSRCQHSGFITIHAPNCPYCVADEKYQCIGSVEVSDVTKVLITKREQSFICWVVLTDQLQTAKRPWRNIFVMDRGQCGHLKDINPDRSPDNVAMRIEAFAESYQHSRCQQPETNINPPSKPKPSRKSWKTSQQPKASTTATTTAFLIKAPSYDTELSSDNTKSDTVDSNHRDANYQDFYSDYVVESGSRYYGDNNAMFLLLLQLCGVVAAEIVAVVG